MGFNPPVPQQDNNWEIRVAVLLSLFFQVIILFLGPVRKRSSKPVYRFTIWSCYLLSDWVADLALGLLLNNIGNIGGNGGSSSSARTGLRHVTAADNTGASPIIFAFWTPFLLLHLGGQDTVTSFSIQDNDLWRRHLIGLLFELCSACVIFFCSLQGNSMIPATVLMFVAGVTKYGERTYSLYSSSVDGALANIFGAPDPGNSAKLMGVFNGMVRAGLPVEIVIVDDSASVALDITKSLEAQAYHLFLIFRRLFFDVKLSYKERQISRAFFPEHTYMPTTMAFQVVEVELNFIYDMVHTKAPVAHSKAGCVLRFIASTCIASALLIFFFHHKRGFTRIDVAITYALLLGGIALDVATLAMLLLSNWTLVFLEETKRPAWLARARAWLAGAIRSKRPPLKRWKEDISQLNLINYCLGKPGLYGGGRRRGFCSPRVVRQLAKVADVLYVREVFDDFFFIRRERLCIGQGEELLPFVFDMVKHKASEAKTMKYKEMIELCSYRGEGVLVHDKDFRKEVAGEEDENKVDEKLKVLVDSVYKDFDESLLLWHIATDLCVHRPAEITAENKYKCIGKTLSEYMLYLLIKQPDILMASAGVGLKLYRDTCAEARRLFQSAVAWDIDLGYDEARKVLLEEDWPRSSVLLDAIILAKVLRKLSKDLMWEVVARVWGEMLIYAAEKCRGSTHVRQLSRGGELITMVWLLMTHTGLSVSNYKMEQEKTNIVKLIVHDH